MKLQPLEGHAKKNNELLSQENNLSWVGSQITLQSIKNKWHISMKPVPFLESKSVVLFFALLHTRNFFFLLQATHVVHIKSCFLGLPAAVHFFCLPADRRAEGSENFLFHISNSQPQLQSVLKLLEWQQTTATSLVTWPPYVICFHFPDKAEAEFLCVLSQFCVFKRFDTHKKKTMRECRTPQMFIRRK